MIQLQLLVVLQQLIICQKDTEGVLWISKGSENDETEKYEIVDDYGTAVDFDWSFTWAGKLVKLQPLLWKVLIVMVLIRLIIGV